MSGVASTRFLALHTLIHPRAVTEFVYRYSSTRRAFVFLSFYLSSPSLPSASIPTSGSSTPIPTPSSIRQAELSHILASLKNEGMEAIDLSDNEMAKSHARYLIGGKSKGIQNERVFRFEFPERPGALRKFLDGLATKFNISLFHYRNQGGGKSLLFSSLHILTTNSFDFRYVIYTDVGKVLCGIQVPPSESSQLDTWLEHLSYPYVEETHNQVYRDFLEDDDVDDRQ